MWYPKYVNSMIKKFKTNGGKVALGKASRKFHFLEEKLQKMQTVIDSGMDKPVRLIAMVKQMREITGRKIEISFKGLRKGECLRKVLAGTLTNSIFLKNLSQLHTCVQSIALRGL